MKTSVKRQCQVALTRRILTLDIEPGAILDEAALSKEYALSRTPLREVFQRLAGEGYLTLTANRSAKVSSMDLHRMRTFFQSSGMIYAAIARLAAENGTASQTDSLLEIQHRFRLSCQTDDFSATALLNHEFHAYIGEMAANPYLTPSYNRLLIDHTRIGHIFYKPATRQDHDRIDKACKQHEELIKAIADHLPVRAVQIILEHWELTRDQIEHFVRPDPLSHEIAEQSAMDSKYAV